MISVRRKLNPEHALTSLGKLVGHVEMTLEICAAGLRWLDAEDPSAAILLRHIWTCSSPASSTVWLLSRNLSGTGIAACRSDELTVSETGLNALQAVGFVPPSFTPHMPILICGVNAKAWQYA